MFKHILCGFVFFFLASPAIGSPSDLLERLKFLEQEREDLQNEIQQYREKYQHLMDLVDDLEIDEIEDENEEDDESVDRRALDCASSADKVIFHARNTRSVNYTSGQKIVFEQVHTNTRNAYNVSTGVFRVPTTGNYQFLATAMSLEGHICDFYITSSRNGELCRTRGGSTHQPIGTCSAMSYEYEGYDIYVKAHDCYINGRKYASFSGHLISV